MKKTDVLGDTYHKIGLRLWLRGFPFDDSPTSPVANWLRRHVKHRPDTLFFIVLGVISAMADIDAQSEGYEGQIDRAIKKMKDRSYKQFQEICK